tara:strand:+ start:886 stop:1293 length:408 start_codon:yes stop_codon:yes gene_type:complete
MPNIPTGLYYRAKCIRTLKTVWNKQSTKDYIIQSVKRSPIHNLKPIIVIDETTKKADCYFINSALNGFDEHHDTILCRQIEAIAEYSINKYKIQTSSKSKEDKIKYCLLNRIRNYDRAELETKDEKAFNKFVKEL